MKNLIIKIGTVLILIGILLYLVPIPCRVNQALKGVYWTGDGNNSWEQVTVEINGTYLRYLFKNNSFYGTVSYDNLPEQFEELYSPCEFLDYTGIKGKTGQLLYFNTATNTLDRVGEICILGNFDNALLTLENGYISVPADTYDEALELAHEIKSKNFSFGN